MSIVEFMLGKIPSTFTTWHTQQSHIYNTNFIGNKNTDKGCANNTEKLKFKVRKSFSTFIRGSRSSKSRKDTDKTKYRSVLHVLPNALAMIMLCKRLV